jgi:hypothetical protein
MKSKKESFDYHKIIKLGFILIRMPLKREYLENLQNNIPPEKESSASFYEKLGDKWFRKSLKEQVLPLRKKDLEYTIKDFTRALKLAREEKDKDRLYGKLKSVNKGMHSLYPIGISGKTFHVHYGILSIASLAAALFSISFNLTGNAIGDIESSSFKWMGLCFFACGLVFALFFSKNKNKK